MIVPAVTESRSKYKFLKPKRKLHIQTCSGLHLYCSAYLISFSLKTDLNHSLGLPEWPSSFPSQRWEWLWGMSLKIAEVINVPAGWQIQSSRLGYSGSCCMPARSRTQARTDMHVESQIQSLIAHCSTIKYVLICTDSCHTQNAVLLWWYS